MEFRFLFKRKRVSSGQRLLVAMSRLQLAGEIGSALRDPKLNEVQLPGLVWGLARENPQQTFPLFQVRRLYCRKISHWEVLRGSTRR